MRVPSTAAMPLAQDDDSVHLSFLVDDEGVCITMASACPVSLGGILLVARLEESISYGGDTAAGGGTHYAGG